MTSTGQQQQQPEVWRNVDELLQSLYDFEPCDVTPWPSTELSPPTLQRPTSLPFHTIRLPNLILSPNNTSTTDGDSSSDGCITPGSSVDYNERQCRICQKVFLHQKAFQRHWREHHNLNNQKLACRICFKPVSNRSVQMRHERSHMGWEERQHSKQFWKECEPCGKIFWDRTEFNRHQTVHNEGQGFSCDFCIHEMKQFKWKSSLKRHLKIVHAQNN